MSENQGTAILLKQLDVRCPRCANGVMVNDRTNFSKSKSLFPIFGMDGPPSWCIVQVMTCPICRYRGNANNGEILANLPAFARHDYPVEPQYAIRNKKSHLSRSATEIMDLLMPTYGNGDLCSRMIYNAINRAYVTRVSNYYSYHKHRGSIAKPYIEKDSGYI
jgi:hypothetical protein